MLAILTGAQDTKMAFKATQSSVRHAQGGPKGTDPAQKRSPLLTANKGLPLVSEALKGDI